MNKKLESLLRDAPKFENVLNLYARDRAGDIRYHNLLIYLDRLATHKPKILLVGEAPGYQGTRNTGVPFTSEYLLMRDNCAHEIHGQRFGYLLTHDNAALRKEPSATVVWRVVDSLSGPPAIWSSFPMHPHKPGLPETNRAPKPEELVYGREVLEEYLALFPAAKHVVAVGNIAQKQLQTIGLMVPKIRHPSHGGATQFEQGLHEIHAQLT